MIARIITIGDEILIGQVVDTNSAWLAREMNALGISIEAIWSIADTEQAIHQALDKVDSEIDLVVMTGGLGPTKDDITKGALAVWFESDWKIDQGVLERVKDHFAQRGIPMPDTSMNQARVPSKCEVLANGHGSAPGMWFEKNAIVYISLPGVPYEMKGVFHEEAIPKIRERLLGQNIVHRTIMTQGIGESSLMQMLVGWASDLEGDGLKLAYLPSAGMVRLRISGLSMDGVDLKAQINNHVESLIPIIREYAFGFDDISLEAVVGELLLKHGYTLSAAESCTGGYLAHVITSVPGSSGYFKGSAITYANEVKEQLLGVEHHDLIEHGAVSEQVALQMAIGARRIFSTDFALAITGVAGPAGGTQDKPVGTVWIAVCGPSGTKAVRFMMGRHRMRNIRKSALQALQMLRKDILKEQKLGETESILMGQR